MEGVALVEERLRLAAADYPGDWSGSSAAATTLLSKGWRPAGALEIAQDALALYEKDRVNSTENDNRGDADLALQNKYEPGRLASVQSLVLKAAVLAGQPEAAAHLATTIEAPAPEDNSQLPLYWPTGRASRGFRGAS